MRVNGTSSFVIFAFSALHTISQHTTNSTAILMISIIVRNGKELTSKVLLRAPRWTWQMFIQKDKTKLIKFLKIATRVFGYTRVFGFILSSFDVKIVAFLGEFGDLFLEISFNLGDQFKWKS